MASVDTSDRLPPHPLVLGLTAALMNDALAVTASWVALDTDLETTLKSTAAAIAKSAKSKPRGVRQAAQAGTIADPTDGLAWRPDARPLGVVAGYVGGCVYKEDDDRVMQVLYLDARLATWLLVPLDKIALFNRVEDKSAAFGLRDVLWLEPDARVVSGTDTELVQRSYLNGPFVSVDDLQATVSGGTFPRTGGLLDEATTPGCCTRTKP